VISLWPTTQAYRLRPRAPGRPSCAQLMNEATVRTEATWSSLFGRCLVAAPQRPWLQAACQSATADPIHALRAQGAGVPAAMFRYPCTALGAGAQAPPQSWAISSGCWPVQRRVASCVRWRAALRALPSWWPAGPGHARQLLCALIRPHHDASAAGHQSQVKRASRARPETAASLRACCLAKAVWLIGACTPLRGSA